MKKTALELSAGNYEVKTGLQESGEIGELAGAMDILSERLLLAEKERKDMEQMRNDFFANVSHELRTPITVMRAYTETLIDGVVRDEDKKRQYYDKMLGECKSMQRLVGDLLTLSKMQNPDFEVEKESVSIGEIFEDVLDSAGAMAASRGITINKYKNGVLMEDVFDEEYSEEATLISGDYERLRQMFMVIVDNAVKFSYDGGNVDISLTEEGDRVYISIRDHGIGIAEEELPFIFDKFYKSKLRQNSKGSGLGLAISREICRKHDGSLEVKSKPGEGTEFIFGFKRIVRI